MEKIRSEATNTRELGDKFEKITRDFLKTDKLYASRFKKIWLWKEWPKNDGADTGIDLVAEQHDGKLCAIQCKCYADDGTLSMKAVSTFLAKATSLKMKHTILVYTGDELTTHAQKVLRDSRTNIITPEHFRQSSIDWNDFPKIQKRKPKELRAHQTIARDDALYGLESHDRGKMIMACGTGKTLTALHIAERQVGKGGIVLYLVPSISLILQSMREWSENSNIKHNYMAVCSDKSTGEDGSITELQSPVSTDSNTLKPYIKNLPADSMNVIFSTYHSIEVVEHAMKGKSFDLVLCDEAHRTTGTEGRSFYTRVHDNGILKAKKRLYMTATPRVYSDAIKSLGSRKGKVIYSMDDESRYGPDFHKLSFSDAVHKHGILADFKVKIAIVDADKVDKDFQQSVADKDRSMPLDERTLLAAVWHGMRYPDDDESPPRLLQRVIAFCNRIDRSEMFAGVMKDPNDNDRSFEGVVNEINQKKNTRYNVEVRHIDGKHRALHRRDEMRWLDESHLEPDTCRIVSNAKCLSEGVDVPALDGVVFLNPRKSVVDVVQSVGRVMRKVPGKDYGYVILPVAIPAGIEYNAAMDDNKTFKIVWEVLNALRSHDEEFAREINKLILDNGTENTGQITPRISVSIIDNDDSEKESIANLFDKIKSKIVRKVGDFDYYDKYGQKLGKATHTIEARLKNKIDSDDATRQEIQKFHAGLKAMINDSVTEKAAIQAIAQHMVLSRVFDELFAGQFTSHNPISVAFNSVISRIRFDEELEGLEGFYEDVKKEVSRIDTTEARQNFIKKIYGNFFESADKKGTEQHGIVYTPIEVIDFIINSVQHVLKEEFGTNFNDRTVKVLEPFAGTGSFLVRLLESGYITTNLYEKYKHDLYANELILLAYYIATVNIETTYSHLRNSGKYVPFDGISYTDTLQINPLYREDARHRHMDSTLLGDFKPAHERIRHQRSSHLHVLMGNPPYSAGQSNFNDDSANIVYPELDKRLKDTYVAKTNAHNKNSLYDSYIRSLRWASDRIGKSGIIAFITNASFIKSEVAAGIRASLAEEFTDVWCFDLRGNQRTQGETSKREGGKIFGSGSRAPVAITILVKNPKRKEHNVHYCNIGDYHSREKKLDFIRKFVSIKGVTDWQEIKPDKHHDWIAQRTDEFKKYLPIGSKEAKAGKKHAVFHTYSRGVATGRDVWAYNSSFKILANNMRRHIEYCNMQDPNKPEFDKKKASWDSHLSRKLLKNKPAFDMKKIRIASYRPFFRQYLYYDNTYNQEQPGPPPFFSRNDSENLVICVPYKFTGHFSTFITGITPDLQLVRHGQCFPLYTYDDNDKRQENIMDATLREYQTHYKDTKISKLDIFYYVYGMLHHPEYRKKYANNLSRELPHVPMAPDFWKFSKSGEKLADLHLNFETCQRYDLGKPKAKFGNLEKMAFAKMKKDGKQIPDKTKLKINGIEIFENVPRIDYTVNGRTPLEWIIDRYRFATDADSGITNNPCEGMTEQKTIEMVERMIFVGIQSDKIISDISKEEFEPKDWTPKKTGLDAFADSTSAQTTL